MRKQVEDEVVETGKRTVIDLGVHGLHPELIRMIGKMKYRSSYGQNLLQHARETANLCAVMASELGLNPKKAKRAGLLHDIGKVPDDEPELPHAILGMKLCEKYKEKPDICNAVGAHHDEVEMQTLLAPIVQVCDAISGARPGARREIVEAYIKRLNDLEQLALSYPGVVKTYAIQAGRELRVIVGADKIRRTVGLKLKRADVDYVSGHMRYFADIQPKAGIVYIYLKSVELWAKEHNCSYEFAENVILMHEFFHYCENKTGRIGIAYTPCADDHDRENSHRKDRSGITK